MTTETTTTTAIPCEFAGCPEDATTIESRVDAKNDHRYVCDAHLSGGVWEASALHGRDIFPFEDVIAMFPPKHRAATKAAAKRITDARSKTATPVCSNFVCTRTVPLSEYEFPNGDRAYYCTTHSAAAVMNGARHVRDFIPSEAQTITTEVDLNALAELEALAEAAVAFATRWQHGIGHSCSAFHDDYQERSDDGYNSNWRTLRDRALAWQKRTNR